MAPAHADLESALLRHRAPPESISSLRHGRISILSAVAALITIGLILFSILPDHGYRDQLKSTGGNESVESVVGVVAADDWMCSEIGAETLRKGGHAADAAVATAICSGVRHPMSSGIGGGAFILVRTAEDGESLAFDARETAPLAASKDMYQNNSSSKSKGALSMGIPGEIAGLHAVWSKYGRLPWKSLFEPSIKLARDGFVVEPYLALSFRDNEDKIMADSGLRGVFAPNGKLLELNDTCYNPKLASSLEAIAAKGPRAMYGGIVGENFIEDMKNAGGVATMEDMMRYRIEVTKAVLANAMGYTILGMPPPSSGTVGISMVLNILGSYGTVDAVKGFLGLHRLIEAVKHMFAMRMNLGDPNFVNITKYSDDMLSPAFAAQVRQKIFDNTTFDPSYYLNRWSQLRDHGTSHICIVDADRNAVSMTTTVNSYFGGGVLSPSTGIVANNEMDDFSTPTESTPDELPPAPSNFIKPNKRPLSSMTPLIILKDDQLAAVIGASGGMNIIAAVIQVFLNHFVLGMNALKAVQHPRFYHTLIPNVVKYENWTALDGERIEFPEAGKEFLEARHHRLESKSGASAVCQFVVHDLGETDARRGDGVVRGMLTAVSDPRKDGRPAGV